MQIQSDDVLNSDIFGVIGFIIATMCLLVSVYSALQLYNKTEFKKTYFYYSMIVIIGGSLLTSILFYSQVVCDTRTLKENACFPWMQDGLNVVLWEITYMIFFALLIGASFKYTIIRTLNQWKLNLQAPLLIVGLVLYLAAAIIRFAEIQVFTQASFLFGTVAAFFSYSLLVDVGFMILLLKNLRETRNVCVVIPKHLEATYIATRNTLIMFSVVFPLLMILFLVSFSISEDHKEAKDNSSNLIKYLLHLAAVVYFALDVLSMVLIKKFAEVEDCSSSYFGLSSTVIGDSKLTQSLP